MDVSVKAEPGMRVAVGDIAAEVISLAVMAGGIVASAHRASHVGRHVPEPEEMTKPADGAAADPPVNHPDRAIDRSSGHGPSSQA
jgi:hypothetical protein